MACVVSGLRAGLQEFWWHLIKRINVGVNALKVGVNNIVTRGVWHFSRCNIKRLVHQILRYMFLTHDAGCRASGV